MKTAQDLPVLADACGAVPGEMVELAVGKVRSLFLLATEPALFARVLLMLAADPAVQRPAAARANLALSGRLIRAQAEAVTLREAVERMGDRLRVRLQRGTRNWAAARGGKPVPLPLEWRHESVPARRPAYCPRPAEARAIISNSSFALARQTCDDAAADLDLLDYDFHLFTEKSTGQDSMIYRSADGYRLAQAQPRPARIGPVQASITISKQPAPRLAAATAASRLEALGLQFLFFVNSETGRSNVIYHRYDGHYGLITPAGL